MAKEIIKIFHNFNTIKINAALDKEFQIKNMQTCLEKKTKKQMKSCQKKMKN